MELLHTTAQIQDLSTKEFLVKKLKKIAKEHDHLNCSEKLNKFVQELSNEVNVELNKYFIYTGKSVVVAAYMNKEGVITNICDFRPDGDVCVEVLLNGQKEPKYTSLKVLQLLSL
jgi:hypothetical protein